MKLGCDEKGGCQTGNDLMTSTYCDISRRFYLQLFFPVLLTLSHSLSVFLQCGTENDEDNGLVVKG